MAWSVATLILLFISLFFEILMLVIFLERRFLGVGRTPAISAPGVFALPSVAIIVPCYNEEEGLALTLDSLLALDYPRDKFEIIVVDDGSSDRTLEIARGYEHDPRVRVFHKENGGKHTAMNYALEHTDAQLVGCLDADSVVDDQALRHIAPVFADMRVGAVTPGIHIKEPKNLLQHMQKVEYRLSIFNRFVQAAIGSAFITPGPFSFFRTSVVKQLGGWRRAHSTEDMEMAMRLQANGYLIANAPQAAVYTATPVTFKHLFRQRVRWTYGFLRNFIDYRDMFGNPKHGNLGLIMLPIALISIGAGIFFFARVLYLTVANFYHIYIRFEATGVLLPHLGFSGFNFFYMNTSMMIFLTLIAVALTIALIATGSRIGTGSYSLPIGTPLFLFLYCFIVPLWLSVAVVRAIRGGGVRWK